MAIYKRFTYGEPGWYSGITDRDARVGKGFFDSIGCSILETELVSNYVYTVNVDNTILLTFNSSSSGANVTYTYNGSTASCGYIQAYSINNFRVICSPTFLVIDFFDHYPRYWYLCYEKIGSDSYFGYYNSASSGGTDRALDSITLTKLGTDDTFIHSGLLKYDGGAYNIDFVENDVLFSSGLKAINDPNCIAISKCDAKRIITLNGKNYYTLSNYTAIELDSED